MPDISLRLGKDVLVIEGPLKASLVRQGVPDDECVEFNNVLDPELVRDVHRFDLLAGINCLVSNTYAGTANALAPFGLEERGDELNHAGMQIVRRFTAQHILAGIGPCGLLSGNRYGPVDDDGELIENPSFEELLSETCRQFDRQIEVLVKSGPEALFFKGFDNLDEIRAAVTVAHNLCNLPLLLCASCDVESGDICGVPIDEAVATFEDLGLDGIGICGGSPAQLLDPFEHLAAATRLPLIVMMDVDGPGRDEGFPIDANAMCMWARTFRDRGANIIGPDTGSSPAILGAAAATVGGIDVVRHGRTVSSS